MKRLSATEMGPFATENAYFATEIRLNQHNFEEKVTFLHTFDTRKCLSGNVFIGIHSFFRGYFFFNSHFCEMRMSPMQALRLSRM